MNDIENRKDIEFLIDAFYKKVIKDETIGYFFTNVIKLDWEKHIPIMNDFWETILLDQIKYKGNPIVKHIELDRKSELKSIHFDQWILLWETTIKLHFEGLRAEEAIKRANLMKELMLYKITQSKNNNFIQ